MTSSVVGLRRSSKALPKAKLASKEKKKLWSVFGGLLPIWSMTAFWIPAKPLHLRSVLSKSMRCTENCNTSSQHRSTERTRFVSTTVPNHISPTNASKGEQIGLQSFASSAVFTWTLANWLPLLQESWQLFAGKMLPQPAGGRKCFPRVHWLLKHGFLHYKITNLLLIGKNVLTVMVPILINKDVFEPSYNDLKFMVKNHNYICTNLIYELNCKNLVF